MKRKVELALVDRGYYVALVGIDHGVCAAIPYDYRAGTVVSFRYDPLEVAVVDRMVLDHYRHPLVSRVQRRAAGNRPRAQHPLHLQAKIKVHPASVMLLNYEDSTFGIEVALVGAAKRLRSSIGTPLASVFLKRHGPFSSGPWLCLLDAAY